VNYAASLSGNADRERSPSEPLYAGSTTDQGLTEPDRVAGRVLDGGHPKLAGGNSGDLGTKPAGCRFRRHGISVVLLNDDRFHVDRGCYSA